MKKIVLVAGIVLFLINSISAQNIPNRDFEVWVEDTLTENLTDWLTTLSDQNAIFLDNVQKSTIAQDGNYSLRLSNSVINNDSIFGYALHGSIGNDGPDGGIPYTSEIDSITGWYQSGMGNGDSAVILVIQYSDVDTVMDVFNMGGVQSSWSRFSFPLTSFSDTLEEVFVGFISTNPDLPGGTGIFNDSSWILFDNIAFTSVSGTPAAIPDHSFENWEVITYENPEDWYTLNMFSAILGDSTSVEKTTDAYSGNYALKITSTYQSVFDDTSGMALNTQIGENLGGGFAFDEVPTNISGYYKYLPAVTQDTAMVVIILSKWDSVGDSTITVKIQGFQLLSQSSYTQFSFDIDTTGLRPEDFDSANIILVSSIYAFDGGAPVGSQLYVDQLWLDSKCAYADTTQIWNQDTVNFQTNMAQDSFYNVSGTYTSYLWSTGDTTSLLNTVTSGNYSLVVNDGVCDIEDETYFSFTIPDPCDYADTISIFEDDSAIIYSSDIAAYYQIDDVWETYLWVGDFEIYDSTSYYIETWESGFYTLTVTGVDGCEIIDSIYLKVINLPWAVEDKLKAKVNVYPNPAASLLNVDFTKNEQSLKKEIIILDLIGNKIMSRFVQVQNERIDISELPKGVYLMNIRIGEEQVTHRVIKK